MSPATKRATIVIPAKNEAATVGAVVADVLRLLPDAEVIVVDDGSTDTTGQAAADAGARVIRHPVSRGNGAAIKTGAREAVGETLVFIDADGQHEAEDIPRLIAKLEDGYDMAVGARSRASQANVFRWFGNLVYNWLATVMVGQPVLDLTSGLRAARAEKFREFLYLLPNGFSYPTTSTICFFRAGYGVAYVPIQAARRKGNGKGHIRLFHDGGRFLLIIFRVSTLYAPLKLFFPLASFFLVSGLAYSTYSLTVFGRFTNFGALLIITSVLVFLIGLVSEQITNLLYRK